MKKIAIVLLVLILQSCGEERPSMNDTIISKNNSLTTIDTSKPIIPNVLKDVNNIIGIWWIVSGDNPSESFEIRKGEIFYPDLFKTYKYKVKNDSIRIKYDDYEGIFKIDMKGKDTLVLTGEDVLQVYYRSKK